MSLLLYSSLEVIKFKIDDPLDAFPVHGGCGIWGIVSLAFFHKNNEIVNKGLDRLERAWIVSQYAGDFNPPHLHRGNISGVGYLKIPSSIKNNKEKDLAGLISFFDGRVSLPRNSPPLVKHRQTFKPRVGDFYIFPAFLMHDVHPFRGEGERRCFSFNAFVDA